MAHRIQLTVLSLFLLALPATTMLCEACVSGDCSMFVATTAKIAAPVAADLPPCHAAMAREEPAGPSLAADGPCCLMSVSAAPATAIPAPPTLDLSDFGRVTGVVSATAPMVFLAEDQSEKHRPPRLHAPLYTLHSSLLI